MRFGSRQIVWSAVGTAVVWATAVAFVSGQAGSVQPAAQSQLLAENVFKNVTVLRGIPVDEFMGTMGVFSAALGFSCEDCHTASSNDWANYAKDVSPRKQMARRMVTMMTEINKQYFGGRQVVTCFSCHRGSNRPKVTPSLVMLYGTPQPDELDVMLAPGTPGDANGSPDPRQVPAGGRRCGSCREAHQLHGEGNVFGLRARRLPAPGGNLREGAESESRDRPRQGSRRQHDHLQRNSQHGFRHRSSLLMSWSCTVRSSTRPEPTQS